MLTLPFEKIITYNFRLVNTFFKIFSPKIYFFRLLVASIVLQEFIFVHSSTLFIHSLTEGLIQTNEKSRRKSAGFFYYRRLRILIFFKGLGLSAPFLKPLTIMLAATVLAARVPVCMFMIVMSAMYVRIEAESARQQGVYRFVGISRHAAI